MWTPPRRFSQIWTPREIWYASDLVWSISGVQKCLHIWNFKHLLQIFGKGFNSHTFLKYLADKCAHFSKLLRNVCQTFEICICHTICVKHLKTANICHIVGLTVAKSAFANKSIVNLLILSLFVFLVLLNNNKSLLCFP